MKVLFASLCVLLVLGHGAYCASTASIRPVIAEHIRHLSSKDLGNAKAQFLEFGEEMIAEFLADGGRRYFCPASEINWEATMQIVKERGNEIDIEGETLCSLIRNHIEHVFEPLTTTLDQCGQAGHSGPLGRYLIMSLKALVKHVCNINGEEILEMVNMCSFSGRFTAPECKAFKNGIEAIQPGNTTRTFVEEVCDTLPLGRDCFLDEVSQGCDLEFTKKAWEDLLNSIISPCSLK